MIEVAIRPQESRHAIVPALANSARRSALCLLLSAWGILGGSAAPRTWTSADGRTLEAELLRVEGDRVILIGTTKPSVRDRDGMMALLLALHHSAGPSAIGQAINAMDAADRERRINQVRYYTLADFRKALEKIAPDAVEKTWP